MTVAGERVGAAGRFNQDFRPNQARLDMHRSDLADINRHLVLTEPRTLPSGDRLVVDLNVSGE